MSEEERYLACLNQAQEAHEARCRRCGGCCGVFEQDPCVHLFQDSPTTYRCSIYEQRGGAQRTVNGNDFNCVPVRRVLGGFWPGDWRCGYKRTEYYL